MKTTRSGISVACHWNGKFNISDMLVPAFDYCSSFKSLLTGKVLISKKSCFNEGEMLIANTKSLHIKLSQHCHWFLGDSKAHLCVYTLRHHLLLFYHNISLNIPSNFLRERQLSPKTFHNLEAGSIKLDELTLHPNYVITCSSYNQKYCKKLFSTTSLRKENKTSSHFSLRNNNSILFSHLWSFAYHIICTMIIVFARQLNHLCHNTQSWHKKKLLHSDLWMPTFVQQDLWKAMSAVGIAAMKRCFLLNGTYITETVPWAAPLRACGLPDAVLLAISATSACRDLHLEGEEGGGKRRFSSTATCSRGRQQRFIQCFTPRPTALC